MDTLHIPSNNTNLYAIIHKANIKKVEERPKHAVVLCSPITHEHDTSYWAIKQLAIRLSKLGFEVARFDYFATGNSSGLSHQLSLQTCTDNIVDIAKFLIEHSNSEKLTLIGLRLGALLALMSSLKLAPNQLILWDPVLNGENYLTQLNEMHSKFLKKLKRTQSHQHNLGKEYMGYPYSDSLIDDLKQLRIDKIQWPDNTTSSILTDPKNKEQKQYIESIKKIQPHFQHKEIGDTYNWKNINTLDLPFLPNLCINQISNILKANQ